MAGPSTGDKVLDVVQANHRFSITGAMKNGFYLVDINGLRGWVFGEWAKPDGGKSKAPIGFVTDEVNFRAGPSSNDAIFQVVPEGNLVVLPGKAKNGFTPVMYAGKDGWVWSDYLQGPQAFDGLTVSENLNLRSGPSTSDLVLLVMPAGVQINVTGEAKNGFLRVSYQGTDGWAFAQYLG